MKNILHMFFLTFLFASCKTKVEDEIAVIWTNKVEVASYVEFFNISQDEYKIIVEYKENPAQEILKSNVLPDIVIAPWLKGNATRNKFKKLDNLVKEKIDANNFYDELLKLGYIDESQYLLPVSFNLPTLIFSISNKHMLENNFTISFDDIKKIALNVNTKKGKAYNKMCFAPRWEREVLYITMQALSVNFKESDDLFSWDENNLKNAISYLKEWTKSVNETSEKEDEFKFKYLYDAPYLLVNNGFCTFYYMPTDTLFSLPKEKMQNLDFRYLQFNETIPCQDDILYAGIIDTCKNYKASEAFLQWFYSIDTQKDILKRKIYESLLIKEFGIAGGFSALKPITEKVFPQYYPLLLSHLPQNQSLKTPHILPNNWKILKDEIIFPYITEASFYSSDDNSNKKVLDLKKRITEWKNSH